MGGFREVLQEGVLCREQMRGCRFSLDDGQFHQDSAHRNPRQVTPATRASLYAATLTAAPRLMEPVYQVRVQHALRWLRAPE